LILEFYRIKNQALHYLLSLKAWLKIVQMEREQAELERKKEEEERRKRKEEAKRQSRILEAAFDGDNDEILAVLEEVSLPIPKVLLTTPPYTLLVSLILHSCLSKPLNLFLGSVKIISF
jgi:hypothetical protein